MREIYSIAFTESTNGNDCYFFQVGHADVTRIRCIEYSPEPHCQRFIYEVYKGEKLFSELHSVTVVHYKD